MSEIADKVKSIVVEQLGVAEDQVTPEAKFVEDLGADSLDIVDIIMAFESEFGTTVPEDDIADLRTIRDLADYVSEHA